MLLMRKKRAQHALMAFKLNRRSEMDMAMSNERVTVAVLRPQYISVRRYLI